MVWLGLGATLVLGTGAVAGCGDDDDEGSATGPSVELVTPAAGDTVAGGVDVTMTASGVTIEPAGEVHDGAGHFHVIIDAGCVDAGQAVPRDADHVHFGKAQTSGTVYAEPGEHDLCLQVADGSHRAMAITDTTTIAVGITSQEEWCAVIGETDELFDEADNNSADFAAMQASYENIRRLLVQLEDGIEYVDADAQERVGAAIAAVTELAEAVLGAENEAAIETAVPPILEQSQPAFDAAAPWIDDACGVDILA